MKLNSRTIRQIVLICLVFLIVPLLKGQEDRNWTLNGYVQGMQNIWIEKKLENPWLTMSSVTNRLDFEWNPLQGLRARAGMRNIMNYGQMVGEFNKIPGLNYGELVSTDPGYMDLSKLWVNDTSYFAYTSIDRLYLEYTWKNLEVTIGRQRINWGINMVWNPNDIFNTFNYFDFDYAERPGCDAVRVQYYTGFTSSVQFAYKLEKDTSNTFALMYGFNKWNYDFQVLAGQMVGDYVMGLGWSGSLGQIGFMGEASYFHDREHFSDTTGLFIGTLGFNYGFNNNLFLQGGLLYNSDGTSDNAGLGSILVFDYFLSAKFFTRARYSTFLALSYPLTPLIQFDFATIVNPNDKSAYLGPSFNFSLTDNIELLLMGQIFTGSEGSEFGDYGKYIYTRLKWSF